MCSSNSKLLLHCCQLVSNSYQHPKNLFQGQKTVNGAKYSKYDQCYIVNSSVVVLFSFPIKEVWSEAWQYWPWMDFDPNVIVVLQQPFYTEWVHMDSGGWGWFVIPVCTVYPKPQFIWEFLKIILNYTLDKFLLSSKPTWREQAGGEYNRPGFLWLCSWWQTSTRSHETCHWPSCKVKTWDYCRKAEGWNKRPDKWQKGLTSRGVIYIIHTKNYKILWDMLWTPEFYHFYCRNVNSVTQNELF